MICAACARGGRPGTTGSDALVVGRDTDPMPVTLTAGSIAHRLVTAGPWTVLLAAALYVPFAPDVGVFPASIDQSFRVSQLSNVLAYAVAILGLDLVTGYTGQLHLGQSAFIGLGALPPAPEWGAMISEGASKFYQWWIAAGPGMAILSVVLATAFLGDGLRDMFDRRGPR